MSGIIAIRNTNSIGNDNRFPLKPRSSTLTLVGAIKASQYNALSSFSWTKLSKLLALLLTTLIVLAARQYPCLCPSTEQNLHQHSAAVTLSSAQDLCSDCGHAKRCCVAHKPAPLVSASPLAPICDLELTSATLLFPTADIVPPVPVIALNKNKAPPISRWPCSRTYLAKQTLLI